jgi:glycerol-3-phosphate dehydrogenase
MKRDLVALSDGQYDLLVVGGGIHGVCAAWEASRRGLAVCLLEKGDFGEATSANSLRIIHGGLRYLQQLDLQRILESARERSLLARMGPHLTRTVPFVIPAYGHGLRGREVMDMAMRVHGALTADTVAPLPHGRTVSVRECMELIPGAERAGLTGGAVWHETQAHNTERLLLTFLKGAVRNGAVVANYVEVMDVLKTGSAVRGVRGRDLMSGQSFEVKTRRVLNAAGPWANAVLERNGGRPLPPVATFAKAINLVTPQLLPDRAISIPFRNAFHDDDAVLNKGVRHFFVVPWGEYSMIGTRNLPWSGDPQDFEITEEDVERFVGEVRESYPIAPLRREHVLSVQGGMVPVVAGGGREVQQLKQPVLVDHGSRDGLPGLFSMVGVKWTTARLVAETAVTRCTSGLEVRARPETEPVPVMKGAHPADLSAGEEAAVRNRPEGVPEAAIRQLVRTYGPEYGDVLRYLAGGPAGAGGAATAAAEAPLLWAEVVHAVRDEMALRLTDVLFRRTLLARAGAPGDDLVRTCAELMAGELGWSRNQMEQEQAAVDEALVRRHARAAAPTGETWRLPS